MEIAPSATLFEALAGVGELLERAGIEEARLDARALLLAAAGISRGAVGAEPEAPLGEAAARRLTDYAARRAAREPVSRILARRGFWTLDLKSPRRARPARRHRNAGGAGAAPRRRPARRALVDCGSGFGLGRILCALLAELPAAWGVAVDLSAPACAATRANLAALKLARRAHVVRGRWADAICAAFDVVVSNPPYIKTGDLAALPPEVARHDPALALDGGVDGLECYRRIIAALHEILAREGVALFEAGAGQSVEIAGLMQGAGLEIMGVERDAGGHERVVAARWAGGRVREAAPGRKPGLDGEA